ncbi:hypothetical protein A3B01_02310 [Candidatus Nomurabacteria bacterium RIFCSPLOWO2_01_FULL_41_52b]|nr:MAG: hypothetical protein A3B01_02310 [Candidatus Nomurabacteria bacterium RIFCSPLOWO2_01_FULL_41_52b]
MPQAQFSLFKPKTKNNYLLQEVVSALQKDIRRGNEENALVWALELFPKYSNYLWKRLVIISAEDMESPRACAVVNALREAFYFTNEDKKKGNEYKHRIFITKAVLFLSREVKSRESDHAQFHVDEIMKTGKLLAIPDFAIDFHTKRGKTSGATKRKFFEEEQKNLKPKGADAYFDKLNMENL